MFDRTRAALLFAFTLTLIVLVNIAWWFFYDRTETLLEQQLSRRLVSISATGAASIGPDLILRTIAGDIDAYADVYAVLDNIRTTDSLYEAFIIDEDYNYIVTTAETFEPVYFLGALNGRFIDSIFIDGINRPIASNTYRTGQFNLKSAYAPLYDSTGLPVAVLGVEANVDYFESLSELKTGLTYATILSLAAGILVGLLFFLVQQRLNRAEQQLYLNETHAQMGRMVAIVAHEIRNPLMILRASAERLTKKYNDTEAGFVLEEVDRLNDIVTGYLNFARPDNLLIGKERPQETNIAELFASLKKHLNEAYREEKIEWLEMPTEVESVTIYKRAMRQVLLNLLINGAEASRSAKKSIRLGIACMSGKEKTVFRVVDHGPGMSKREIKAAFMPFYSNRPGGTGLGLYLAQRLIKEMNGTIEIDSVVDKKTEVVITISKTAEE